MNKLSVFAGYAPFAGYTAEDIELAEAAMLKVRAGCMPQVDALMAAGWKFELPEIVNDHPNLSTEPWQWYWRSPPKRQHSKGRRYLSTNQAFNALKRMSTS